MKLQLYKLTVRAKLLTTILIAFAAQVMAQDNPITGITISLPANPDANVANWGTGTSTFVITASARMVNGHPDPRIEESRILVFIKKDGKKLLGSYTGATAPAAEFNAPTKVWSGRNAAALLGREGTLQPGDYELSVQFFGTGAASNPVPLADEKTRPFTIKGNDQQAYQPPQLISPATGTEFKSEDITQPLTFRWTPVIPKPQEPVTYRLSVWQLMQGQTGPQAIKANQPILTKDVENLTQTVVTGLITGPCKPPYLCDFVWTVQALNREGKPVGGNNGTSERSEFTVGLCDLNFGLKLTSVECLSSAKGINKYRVCVAATYTSATYNLAYSTAASGFKAYAPTYTPYYTVSNITPALQVQNMGASTTVNYCLDVDVPIGQTAIKVLLQGDDNNPGPAVCQPGQDIDVKLPVCKTCDCGTWGSLIINDKIKYACGSKEMIPLKCGQQIKFTDAYQCSSNDTACKAAIVWSLQKEGAGSIATGTGAGSISGSFTPAANGVYTLTLNASCNGKKCDPCVYTFSVKDCAPPADPCSPMCNTSFEQVLNGQAPSTYVQTSQDNVPCWKTTASDGKIEIWHSGFGGVNAYSGNYFAELNATQVGTLYQSFTVSAPGTMAVSFAHRGRYAGADVMKISLVAPDGTATNFGPFSADNTGWHYQTTAAVPVSPGTYTLKFVSVSSNGGAGPANGGNFLDSVTVHCAPIMPPAAPCSPMCNTSFEQVLNGQAPSTYVQTSQDNVPCWKTTASDGKIEIWHSGFGGVNAYSGNYFAELNATQVGTLYQSFTVSAPGTMAVSFAHRGRYVGADVMKISLVAPDGTATNFGPFSADNTGWHYQTTAAVPVSPGTYTLKFVSVSSNGGAGPANGGNFLDSVTVHCAPIMPPADPCSPMCNTSFEQVLNGQAPSTYVQTSQENVPCWKTTASDGKIEIWHSGFGGVNAYSGNYFAELNATQVGTLYQSFTVSAPGTMAVSFAHRGRYVGADVMKISLVAPDGTATNFGPFSADNTGWHYQTTAAVPVSPGTYTLKFVSVSSNGGAGPANGGNFLDSVTVHCATQPVTGCVTPPKGMVAWWPLDETSGQTATDLAGFNNIGAYNNAPSHVAGKVSGSLQFNGSSYVEVKDHPEINFGKGDFSFDAWIQTKEQSGAEDLVDKRTGTPYGYSFFIANGKLSLQLADGTFTSYVSPLFVADGKWHHIAVTVSRANKKGIIFYVDGVPAQYGDPTNHQGSLDNKTPLRIASQSFSHDFQFKGTLDEIELFNRVLNSDEVVSIFKADTAGKCKKTALPKNK